jgi:hypothetical protein
MISDASRKMTGGCVVRTGAILASACIKMAECARERAHEIAANMILIQFIGASCVCSKRNGGEPELHITLMMRQGVRKVCFRGVLLWRCWNASESFS